MKKLLYILAAAMLLSATNSFASTPARRGLFGPGGEKIKLLSNEEFFSKSDYIIEFKSAGVSPTFHYTTYDVGGKYNPNEFYTSGFVIVTRVYKNDEAMSISPGDTLNWISKGGQIVIPVEGDPLNPIVIDTPYPEDYETGERGRAGRIGNYTTIYFMKKSDLPENPDVSKRSKYPKVSMLQDIKRAAINLGSKTSPGGPVSGLNDLHFDNRYELYKYMEQFEGVKVPLSDMEQMQWDLRRDKDVFEQYLRERNINWQEHNERARQRVDSFRIRAAMEYPKIKEDREKKTENKDY